MGGFYDEVIKYRHDREAMAELARAQILGSVTDAGRAYEQAAGLVVEGFVEASNSEYGHDLLTAARALSWSERADPASLFREHRHRLGPDVARLVFGVSLPAARDDLAARSDLIADQAQSLLEIISMVALGSLIGTAPADEITPAEFLAPLRAEGGIAAPARPVPRPGRESGPRPRRSGPLPAAPPGVRGPRSGTAPIATEHTNDGRKRRRGLLIGALALVALAVGGGIFLNQRGSSTGSTDTAELATQDDTAEGVDGDPGSAEGDDATDSDTDSDTGGDTDGDDGTPGPETVSDARPDIVSLSVPLRNITDPAADATGTLDFTLNTITGEICYEIVSENIAGPYRSHIHAGGYGVDGGIVVDLGPQENGATGCVDNLPVDTNAILADRAGHYAELHDVSEEFTIRGQLSETVTGDIVSITVPMSDAQAINPDAEGVLTFDFNTVTGEVCYEVTSSNIEGPYRSHIHVGLIGVEGGIVVDLGRLESGQADCVRNLPIDTNAILADRAGHYAELHDVSEDFTIRGQLSNTIAADDQVRAEPVVDTDGGGARILLDDGTIYLEGEVPDEATAADLRASLSGVDDETGVIDNLRVVSGAPLPSGRVVIADAIVFDSNSDQLREIDDATLAAIVALAGSREDWILTIVGHTDDQGADLFNLELSLRRATALRDLLVTEGIPEDNLRIRGGGERTPIGDNTTEAGRAQNRRIEFEFTPAE